MGTDPQWHTLEFTLQVHRKAPAQRAHPLSVIDAWLRDALGPNSAPYVFHATAAHVREWQLSVGDRIPIRLCMPFNETRAQDAANALSRAANTENLSLVDAVTMKTHSLALVSADCPQELCLEFFSPFSFNKASDTADRISPNTELTSGELLWQLRHRLQRFLGIKMPDVRADFRVLSHFWRFVAIRHVSESMPGTTKLLKGCVGKLYLRGRLNELLPWLKCAADCNIGLGLSFGRGHFKLYEAATPAVWDDITDIQTLVNATQNVIDENDHTAVQAAARHGAPFVIEDFAIELGAKITIGRFESLPSTLIRIPREGRAPRIVEDLGFDERVLQLAILQKLGPILDLALEPCSVAYRKGVTVPGTIHGIRAALADGFRHALRADIEDFFPNVDHRLVRSALETYLPLADQPLVDLVMRLLRTGHEDQGHIEPRTQGLPQGAPLSPLLANLVLDPFDEVISALPIRFFRYSDDFLVLARTADMLDSSGQQIAHSLAAIGLKLNASKTEWHTPEQPFSFIGVQFGPGITEVEVEAAHRLPLYLTDAGAYVAANGDALEIRHAGALRDLIPVRRISQIMALQRVSFSSAAISRLQRHNVSLTLTLDGAYRSSTWLPERPANYDLAVKQRQRYETLAASARLAIAHKLVDCKLGNILAMHRQRYKAGDAEWFAKMASLRADVHTIADTRALRGLEGFAARLHFQRLSALVDDPYFAFRKRLREQPDAINSLLNFGYYLLFGRINATLRGLGLNPFLGYLHETGERYETLVCDLQEPFRANVDRLILRLIGLRMIRREHFEQRTDGVRLRWEPLKLFVQEFETELLRQPKNGGLPLSQAIYAQCLNQKHYALGQADLFFYQFND